MSTPHYIILSDSEDEYPSTPTVEPSDFHSDMDMDTTSDDEIVTPHTPSTNDPMDTGPSEEEPSEEDPSEEEPSEEDPSEEEPSEEEIETPSTPTPVVTLPTPAPHGPRTRVTARKSVILPRQEISEPIGDILYTDIPVDTSTPTRTTPIPTPATTTTTTAPIFTTSTAATTTFTPEQDHSSRYREWMHYTLQTWRQVEGLPSTFELGESSTTPSLATVTPILVAQLARQEREQRALEEDFGRYTSQNNASIRRSFAAMNDDGMATDRVVYSMRTQLRDAEVNIAILRSRVEVAERQAAEAMRRITELEETLRRQSGTDRASTSQRPGHP